VPGKREPGGTSDLFGVRLYAAFDFIDMLRNSPYARCHPYVARHRQDLFALKSGVFSENAMNDTHPLDLSRDRTMESSRGPDLFAVVHPGFTGPAARGLRCLSTISSASTLGTAPGCFGTFACISTFLCNS